MTSQRALEDFDAEIAALEEDRRVAEDEAKVRVVLHVQLAALFALLHFRTISHNLHDMSDGLTVTAPGGALPHATSNNPWTTPGPRVSRPRGFAAVLPRLPQQRFSKRTKGTQGGGRGRSYYKRKFSIEELEEQRRRARRRDLTGGLALFKVLGTRTSEKVTEKDYERAKAAPENVKALLAERFAERELLLEEQKHRKELPNRVPDYIHGILVKPSPTPIEAFQCGLYALLPSGLGIVPGVTNDARTLILSDLVEVRRFVRFSAPKVVADALDLVGSTVEAACLLDSAATAYLVSVKKQLHESLKVVGQSIPLHKCLAEPLEYVGKKVSLRCSFNAYGHSSWEWKDIGGRKERLNIDASFSVVPRSATSVLDHPKAEDNDNDNDNNNNIINGDADDDGDDDGDDDDDDDDDDGEIYDGNNTDDSAGTAPMCWKVATNVPGVVLNVPYDYYLRLEDGTLLIRSSHIPECVFLRLPGCDNFSATKDAAMLPPVNLGVRSSNAKSWKWQRPMDMAPDHIVALAKRKSVSAREAFHCALYDMLPRGLGVLPKDDVRKLSPSNLIMLRRELRFTAPRAALNAIELLGSSLKDTCQRDAAAMAFLEKTKCLLREMGDVFLERPPSYEGAKITLSVTFEVHGHTWSWSDIGGSAEDELHIDAKFIVTPLPPEQVLALSRHGGGDAKTWKIATSVPDYGLHVPFDCFLRLADGTLIFRSSCIPELAMVRHAGEDCFHVAKDLTGVPVVQLAIPKQAVKSQQ